MFKGQSPPVRVSKYSSYIATLIFIGVVDSTELWTVTWEIAVCFPFQTDSQCLCVCVFFFKHDHDFS